MIAFATSCNVFFRSMSHREIHNFFRPRVQRSIAEITQPRFRTTKPFHPLTPNLRTPKGHYVILNRNGADSGVRQVPWVLAAVT